MFMRLVQVKVNPENMDELRNAYENEIIPVLEEVRGCRFASLVQNVHQTDECISLTIWDSAHAAEDYVHDGTYARLLEIVQPYLSNTTEWKVQLSADSTLEYIPINEEPTVNGYHVNPSQQGVPSSEVFASLYVRILSLKLKHGKMEQLRQTYESKVLPILQMTEGCRYAYLTEDVEDKDEAISVTIWDSQASAKKYETSGTFESLVGQVKQLLNGLYQWKMSLGRDTGRTAVTSEDISVGGYQVVTGKSFL